jgi:hypothetical protein
MKTTSALAVVPLVWMLAGLCGCVNPYSSHYEDYTYRMPAQTRASLGPPSTVRPKHQYSNNVVEAIPAMREQGYEIIGSSAFSGGKISLSRKMIDQAMKVGADFIIYESRYSGSRSYSLPVTTYQPGQTYNSTYSGSIYNSTMTGSATYHGNSYTTTPGTYNTEYIPMTDSVYANRVVYFRKTISIPDLENAAKDIRTNNKSTVEVIGDIIIHSPTNSPEPNP